MVVNEEKMCSEDAFLLTGQLNARCNSLGKVQEGKDSNPRFGERSKGRQDTDRNVGSFLGAPSPANQGRHFWGEQDVLEADATLRVLHGIVLGVVHGRAHFEVFAQDLLPNNRAEKC